MLSVLLAGGALAADTLAWLALQHRIGRRLDDVAAQAGRRGWRFEASSRARGGWPLTATMRMMAPSLAGPIDHGRFRWSAEQATLSLGLLHPKTMTLHVERVQSVSAGTGMAAMSLRLAGAPLIFSLPASADRTRAIGFVAGRERGAFSLPGFAGSFQIQAMHGTWRRAAHAQALTIRARGISGLDADRGEFGTATAFIEASVASSPEPASAASGNADRLLVSQACVRWPDAMLQSSGQASLDGRAGAGPDGHFSLRITNGPALLGRLVRSGQVTPQIGTAIGAVLGLIAAGEDTIPRAAGEQSSITLPITVEAGIVRLGEIPLLRLPGFDASRPDDARTIP